MEDWSEFFNGWYESQKKLVEGWVKVNDNFQNVVSKTVGSNKGTADSANDLFNLYNLWTGTMGGYFEEILKNYPLGPGKDIFSKMLGGANVYVNLYEFLGPVYKEYSKKGFDFDSFKEMFEPSKYKEVIDKLFGFSSPGFLGDFYSQAAKLTGTWGDKSQDFVKPWAEAIQKNMTEFPNFMLGKPETCMSVFNNMYNVLEGGISKMWNIPAVGENREKIELMMKTLDKFSKYLTKNTSFQHQIYLTGQKAMKKVTERISQQLEKGAAVKNFDEFFKLWCETNDETYTGLFETEDFSKLQAELLDTALEARKNFHALIELSLKDWPIPLRSEMDGTYKTIYELKKKVRTLEQKIDRIAASPKSAAK